jgi:hypothetical protein
LVLAEEVRKRLPKKTRCKIEIRAVEGPIGRGAANRLLSSLSFSGLDVKVVEVASSPREEILIESSHETAEVALALQSAFLTAGNAVQLLVHHKSKPQVVVLHLGMDC